MFPQYTSLLQSAGFVNVEAHEEPTPIGPWSKNKRLKEIGVFFQHQFTEAAVDGYSLALSTRFGGGTEEETYVLLAHVRKEIKSNKVHVYTHFVRQSPVSRMICTPTLGIPSEDHEVITQVLIDRHDLLRNLTRFRSLAVGSLSRESLST